MLPENDERFVDAGARRRHYSVFKPMLEEALSHRSVGEWLSLFEGAGVPCGRVNNIYEAMAEPQLQSRGMLVQTSSIDKLRLIASPINLSSHPKREAWMAAEDEDGPSLRSKL
jgi:formyl-CoA transferase